MKVAVDQVSSGAVEANRRREAKGRRRSGGGGGGGETEPLLQRLFEGCQHVFRGPGTVPEPADVVLIRGILDKIGPGDVNLSAEQNFFKATDAAALQRPLTITRTTIYTCTNFSIVIFFLPPTAVIPLHNHPGMTVFSKLLLGSLHIKSYDWAEPAVFSGAGGGAGSSSSPDDRLRLAEVVRDGGFSAPSDTLVLYPAAGGNMHRFTAATPCALLDVLGPPYSKDRDCTYYQDFPYSHCPSDELHQHRHGGCCMDHDERRLGWLKETAMPEDLEMYEMPYRGPPIL
uniref:cysteine dioxygenase n=1 Tax=Oryza brachyantha TaxID=4533 RepID=J3LR90_ORYBR